MKKFKIEKEHHGYKISEYLREIQNYSGRGLRNIEVFLDGKKVRTTQKIRKQGLLKVVEKEKGTNIKPIKIPLDIVFEDEDILVVNKQPYLVTHPTKKKVDVTLANGIVYYFQEKYGKEMVPRFYNRLDMDTSGLIIIAKNSFTQAFLQNFGDVKKYYMALVHGIIKEEMIKCLLHFFDKTSIRRLFMKRLFVLTMLLLVAVFSVSAAHGGRTDKNGCHVDRSTGKRHCH